MKFGPPTPLQSQMMLLACGSSGGGSVAALDPPVNTVAPVVSGTAQEGETLTGTTGTWTGAAVITYTRQWARYNVSSVFVENISGATSSTYVLVAADVGYKIGEKVTGTNADGSSEALSNLTASVASAPVEFPTTLDGTLVFRFKGDEIPGLSDGDTLVEVNDISGLGNDLATIGGTPTWESGVINGHAVIRGDGVSDYVKGTFAASVTGGNFAYGYVRKWATGFSVQQVLVDSSNDLGAASYRSSTNVGNAFYNGGSVLGPAASGATDVFAYVECRVNGASSTIKINGSIVASGTLLTTAVPGLTLFAAGGTGQKSDADIAELFFINTPSVADLTACKEYAMSEYGLAPPAGTTANIVCVGDSNTAGTLTAPESYPSQLQGLLNTSYPNAYVNNRGVSGYTWANLQAEVAATTALIQGGIPNILVVQCGLNDFAAGTAIATIIASMDTYVTDMAAVYDDVVLLTVMPAVLAGVPDLTGTDFENLADGYVGATLPANTTVVDQRTAAPTIGADGAELTATFQADNKHLSASGNLVEAQTVETAVLTLLP